MIVLIYMLPMENNLEISWHITLFYVRRNKNSRKGKF